MPVTAEGAEPGPSTRDAENRVVGNLGQSHPQRERLIQNGNLARGGGEGGSPCKAGLGLYLSETTAKEGPTGERRPPDWAGASQRKIVVHRAPGSTRLSRN